MLVSATPTPSAAQAPLLVRPPTPLLPPSPPLPRAARCRPLVSSCSRDFSRSTTVYTSVSCPPPQPPLSTTSPPSLSPHASAPCLILSPLASASAPAPAPASAPAPAPASAPSSHGARLRGAVGFDGFVSGKELHYYRERRTQVQVNAAGALLHDWAKEQYGIQKLVDEGRVVLL